MKYTSYVTVLLCSVFLSSPSLSMQDQAVEAVLEGGTLPPEDKSLPLFQKSSVLNLANCKIDDATSISLAKALETNQTITQLNLSNNPLTDNGGKKILAAIKTMPNLQTLSLSQTQIADGTAADLGIILKDMSNIHRVYLSQTKITQDGYNNLFTPLRDSKNSLFISLADTQLSSETLKLINDISKSNEDFIVDVTFQNAKEGSLKFLLDEFAKSKEEKKD